MPPQTTLLRRSSSSSYFLLRHKKLGGILYPPRYSKRLLFSSIFVFPIALIVAIFYGLFDCVIPCILIIFNSINYWRRPALGMRRNLDIFFAVTSVLQHWYLAYNECQFCIFKQYMYLSSIGTILFCLSAYYGKQDNYHLDTLFHFLMHIWGVSVNVWFYPSLYQARISK